VRSLVSLSESKHYLAALFVCKWCIVYKLG
jgi:hypothetical protein